LLLEAAKSNLGSIIQDIVYQHNVRQNKKVPSDSVLYQFDKFLGAFGDSPKKKSKTADLSNVFPSIESKIFKPQFMGFIRKVTLPRNVVLDYKSDRDKEAEIRRDRKKLHTILTHHSSEKANLIRLKPKKMTQEDKVDILYNFLKKEECKNKKCFNKTIN
jgi:hypothetical protein